MTKETPAALHPSRFPVGYWIFTHHDVLVFPVVTAIHNDMPPSAKRCLRNSKQHGYGGRSNEDTADWISQGQSIDHSLATGADSMKPTFPALQRSLTLRDWWKLSKKSACERGHVSITPLPKNATTLGTRLCWKKWTAKTSKSWFSDLNRVPLSASPTGRRTTREHL